MMIRPTVIRSTAIGCLVGCLWLAHTQQTPQESLRIKRVKGDLYLISPLGESDGPPYFSRDGIVAAYVTDEGVILIDDRRGVATYPKILDQLATVTDKPVRYVINTHHHLDHSGGNGRLIERAEVIAHANARTRMVESNAQLAEQGSKERHALPRVTFKEEAAIALGGKEVRLYYFGRGHTDGDIVVYFPAEKVVHMGDLFAASRGFFIDANAGGSGREWGATLGRTLDLDFDTVIRGHVDVTTREDLVRHRDKFLAVNGKLERLIGEAVPRDEILDRINLDDILYWSVEQSGTRYHILLMYDELVAGL